MDVDYSHIEKVRLYKRRAFSIMLFEEFENSPLAFFYPV